jgi:hypothetical protein
MKHQVELPSREDTLDQLFIGHTTLDKPRSFVDIVQKPTAKIVDDLDSVPSVE